MADLKTTREIAKQEINIYCLCSLNEEEQAAITAELRTEWISDKVDWVVAKLVPWTGEADGTERNIYRLFYQYPERAVKYFVDRQYLEDKTIVAADADMEYMLFSKAIHRMNQDLMLHHRIKFDRCAESHFEPLMEAVMDGEHEAMARGLPYGRMPGRNVGCTWSNLDIANMDLIDMIDGQEEGMRLIKNPEWDGRKFLQRMLGIWEEDDGDDDRHSNCRPTDPCMKMGPASGLPLPRNAKL